MPPVFESISLFAILISAVCLAMAVVLLRSAIRGPGNLGPLPLARLEAGLLALAAFLAALIPLKLHPMLPKAIVALMLITFMLGLLTIRDALHSGKANPGA